MDNKNYIKIWKDFKKLFEKKGFEIIPTNGLIDDTFAEIFVPCAVHADVGKIISSSALNKEKRWINLGPVFRSQDLNVTGYSNRHLALFEMMTFVLARPLPEIGGLGGKDYNLGLMLNILYKNKINTSTARRVIYQIFDTLFPDIFSKIDKEYIKEKDIKRNIFETIEELKKINKKLRENKNSSKNLRVIKNKLLAKYMAYLHALRFKYKYLVRKESFEYALRYLKHRGIDIKNLYFTHYSGGYKVGNLTVPRDFITKNVLLKEFKIPANKILDMYNKQAIEILLERRDPQVGPRSEIYYKLPTGDLVEIGTAVFDEYFYDKVEKTVKFSENLVHGCAFGLQRLEMISPSKSFGPGAKQKHIEETSMVYPLIKIIKSHIRKTRPIYNESAFLLEKEDVIQLAQSLSSITLLMAEGMDKGKYSGTIREREFNMLLKVAARSLIELQFFDEKVIREIIKDVGTYTTQIYSKIYPVLYNINESKKENIIKKVFQYVLKEIPNPKEYNSLTNEDWSLHEEIFNRYKNAIQKYLKKIIDKKELYNFFNELDLLFYKLIEKEKLSKADIKKLIEAFNKAAFKEKTKKSLLKILEVEANIFHKLYEDFITEKDFNNLLTNLSKLSKIID